MGPPRELLGRLSQRRAEAAVLVQIQLLVQAGRPMMKTRTNPLAALCLLAAIGAAVTLAAQTAPSPQQAVDAAYAKYKGLQEGKNADYIPALAKVDPNLFGVAIVGRDGKVYSAGDVSTRSEE